MKTNNRKLVSANVAKLLRSRELFGNSLSNKKNTFRVYNVGLAIEPADGDMQIDGDIIDSDVQSAGP